VESKQEYLGERGDQKEPYLLVEEYSRFYWSGGLR
jgi:hypothetical protein